MYLPRRLRPTELDGRRGAEGRHGQPVLSLFSLLALLPLLPLLPLLIAGLAAGCASPGGPGPSSATDRLPNYTQPVRQISLRAGRLGFGGLEIGMSFRDVQLAIGARLPPPGAGMKHDEMCDTYWADAVVVKQKLRLEMGGLGETSRLKAIFLRLENPAGDLSTLDLASALRGRFPDLEYVPSPHEKDLPESANPRPLYRLAKAPRSGTFWIDPKTGVYFGDVCVD